MAHQVIALRSAVSTPAGKNYKICEFGYKTQDGKVKGMRLVSFGEQANNFEAAAKAYEGDVFDVEFSQNAKGFWQFTPDTLKATGENMATRTAAVKDAKPTHVPKSGGNWETSDERAKRQVMIVRQSSLANAIAYLDLVKNSKASPDDVIAIASGFEAYVLSNDDEEVTSEVE